MHNNVNGLFHESDKKFNMIYLICHPNWFQKQLTVFKLKNLQVINSSCSSAEN